MKVLIIDDDLVFGKKLGNLINEKFGNEKNDIVIKINVSSIDLKQKFDYYFS